MPARHGGEHLVGVNQQLIALRLRAAQIRQVVRGDSRYRGAIGFGRRFVHDMLQHGDAQFRIDRVSDREPNPLPERGQRQRLFGQEQDIAGLHSTLPRIFGEIQIKRGARRAPRLGFLFQAHEGAAQLQQQIGAPQGLGPWGQFAQLLADIADEALQ